MRIYKVNYLPKSRLDRTFDKSIPVSNSAKNCHREHCSIISMVNNRLIEHTLDNQVPVENKHIESQWKITLIIENGCFRDYVKLKFWFLRDKTLETADMISYATHVQDWIWTQNQLHVSQFVESWKFETTWLAQSITCSYISFRERSELSWTYVVALSNQMDAEWTTINVNSISANDLCEQIQQ